MIRLLTRQRFGLGHGVVVESEAAKKRTKRIALGIDPGTTISGWGVVESCGHSLSRVDSSTLRLRGERAVKLERIFSTVRELCQTYQPDALSLEQSFVGDNIQTALRLGEARGAVMVAAALEGVVVHEYAPASIKIAVSGSGRADKTQMQAMVARLLDLDVELKADEADALGAAICHLNTAGFEERLAGAPAIGLRKSRSGARAARWR